MVSWNSREFRFDNESQRRGYVCFHVTKSLHLDCCSYFFSSVLPFLPDSQRSFHHPCPKTDYKQYGTRCFSTCRLPPKDELSSFCIEPEVRTAIELYSSCAEDCNENNIHDFCFACPDGMKKKDCQCVKQEKIYWRDIFTRENRPAIMLLEYWKKNNEK